MKEKAEQRIKCVLSIKKCICPAFFESFDISKQHAQLRAFSSCKQKHPREVKALAARMCETSQDTLVPFGLAYIDIKYM